MPLNFMAAFGSVGQTRHVGSSMPFSVSTNPSTTTATMVATKTTMMTTTTTIAAAVAARTKQTHFNPKQKSLPSMQIYG